MSPKAPFPLLVPGFGIMGLRFGCFLKHLLPRCRGRFPTCSPTLRAGTSEVDRRRARPVAWAGPDAKVASERARMKIYSSYGVTAHMLSYFFRVSRMSWHRIEDPSAFRGSAFG